MSASYSNESTDITEMLKDDANAKDLENIKGYYACYLNLINPLVIDCNGAEWENIPEQGISELIITRDDGSGGYDMEAAEFGPLYYVSYPYGGLDNEGMRIIDIEKEFGEHVAEKVRNSSSEEFRLYRKYNDSAYDEFTEEEPESGNTRYWCGVAKDNGYDGVIFNDLKDNGDYGNFDTGNVYVAFDSNQVKSVYNEHPTDNEDLRFSISENSKDYNQKQYNDFGWARANDIISPRENARWKSALKNIKGAPKTSNGERIVAVGDIDGVDNVLVFTKGTFANPKIERVVRINVNVYANYDVETDLDLYRRYIYEEEAKSNKEAYRIINAYAGRELLSSFSRGDWPTFAEYKRTRSFNSRESGSREGSGKNYGNDGYDDGGRSNSKPLSEAIPTEDEVLKFSMDNDLYDPLLDGDISDEAKSRRVKVRCELLALVEDISRSFMTR